MGKEIMTNVVHWKDKTTAGDSALHRVYGYRGGVTTIIRHICHVLTDKPQEYGPSYKIVRKFGNKYLIEAQETYTLETWVRIHYIMEKLIGEDKISNVED